MTKNMGTKWLLLVLACGILSGCVNHKRELLGYDFELFDHTPVEELAQAVKDQDTKRIKGLILNKKIDVNFQEKKFGHTVLMLATMHNLNQSVKILLQLGADPNLKDGEEDDENAFLMACEMNTGRCNVEIVRMMIAYKADVNTVQIMDTTKQNVRSTPLMVAATANCLETVKVLVKAGAKIDQYTYYEGYGAITSALIHNNIEIAKYLIVDCKAPIPEYCFIRKRALEDERKLTITDMLMEENYPHGSEDARSKKEILAYLKKNGLK